MSRPKKRNKKKKHEILDENDALSILKKQLHLSNVRTKKMTRKHSVRSGFSSRRSDRDKRLHKRQRGRRARPGSGRSESMSKKKW